MSGDSDTFHIHPDTEGILSVKHQLEKGACKDEVLLSNLDFSERVLRHNPLNKIMTLQVKGQWQCLTIGKVDSVIYTVSSENDQTRIDCCVYCDEDMIKDSDIKELHFSVHSCQDQTKSCFTAAKDAIRVKHQALKINCNRFSITYTIKAIPDRIVTIETKCHFKLNYVTAEALLKAKCWMENEKPNCHELINCLDYLVEIYLTAAAPISYNCRFILHGNKEMAEITTPTPGYNQCMKQYIVKCGKDSKVSIYPPFA